jgi:hypothetical protein
MTAAGVAPGVGVDGTAVGSAVATLVGVAATGVAAGVGVSGSGVAVAVATATAVGGAALVPVDVEDDTTVAGWAAVPEHADSSRAAGAPARRRNARRRQTRLVTSLPPHRVPAVAVVRRIPARSCQAGSKHHNNQTMR